MSPTMLATMRRIERDTRQLAAIGAGRADTIGYVDPARYPVDYFLPAELLWRWRGPGRFFYATGSGC
jgi:hypothetical protein